jgi:predicted nucleotidyltransferase
MDARGKTWEDVRVRVTPSILSAITQRIVAAFKPTRIILFGSHAYGSPGPNSDVDLFVIMNSRESMARRIRRVAEVAHVPFLPMDVLVYTPAEIRERLRLGDSFISEILAKGRLLFRRGPLPRMGGKGRD